MSDPKSLIHLSSVPVWDCTEVREFFFFFFRQFNFGVYTPLPSEGWGRPSMELISSQTGRTK